MLSQINLALSAGTTTLLLLLAALLFRDFRTVAAGRLAIAFALGSAAHAMTATSGFAPPVTPWQAALIAVSTGNVVVFWLFARALFDDAFRLRRWHAVPWAAVVALSLVNCLVLVPAQTLGPASFRRCHSCDFAGLSWRWRSAKPLRPGPPTWSRSAGGCGCSSWSATAVYAGFNAVLQIFARRERPAGHRTHGERGHSRRRGDRDRSFADACQGRDDFCGWPRSRLSRPSPQMNRALPIGNLVDALMRLMSDERIYRHEGITIGTLATKLAVPEYRLRRLINQQLGYRNFNVFLNDHRIEEAKAALADPSQAEVPVITIAMDAGFQSLGPFNRAFKATTGVTPSEYRRLNEARA